jgi:hypothetical protein
MWKVNDLRLLVPWANVLLDYGIVIQTLQIFYFVYALARIIEVFHALFVSLSNISCKSGQDFQQ